jgi:hypothetical protein
MVCPKKIEVVVTDNATTITNAVVMSDFKSLRCIAHTLNLAVKDITEKEEKLKIFYRNVVQSLAILNVLQKLRRY